MNIGSIFDKVSNIIDTKKEENRLYQELFNKSLKFDNFQPMTSYNSILNEGKWEEILGLCPNLNESQAKVVDSLIPVSETYLKIIYITQRIDNCNYIIVFTDKYVWVMDKEKYLMMQYQDILVFDIISKSLMTQVVNFNNIIIGIDTTQNDLNELYQLVKDIDYRNNFIRERTKYLCGIVPIFQKLNKINSGISIDNNKNVVFHDKKLNNYVYRYQDIKNYELLEDQIVVLKKKTLESSHSMTSVKQTCNNMTLRVTLVNDQVFSIMLLEPTAFNSQYNHNDSIYIKHYKFAKEIFDKLDSLEPKLY